MTIPLSRRRRLALGFFKLHGGPREWGYGCIWFLGPNHYFAFGRYAFGWGVVNPPGVKPE
jgi:hypothetical protein